MIDDPLNYYAILNVSTDSSAEEIKESYHNLIKNYHPDKQDDIHRQEANELIFKINRAYEVLGDPIKRRAYHVRVLVSRNNFGSYNEMIENMSENDLIRIFSNHMANSYFKLDIDATDVVSVIVSKNMRAPNIDMSKISLGFKNIFPLNTITKTSLKLDSVIDFNNSRSESVCKTTFEHNLFKLHSIKHSLLITSIYKLYEVKAELLNNLTVSLEFPLSLDLILSWNILNTSKYSIKLKLSDAFSLYVGTDFIFSQGLFFGFSYNFTKRLIAQMHFSLIEFDDISPNGHVSLHYLYSEDTQYGCFLKYELFQTFTLKLYAKKVQNRIEFEISPATGFFVNFGFSIGSFEYSLPIRLSYGISTYEYIPIAVGSFLLYNLWGYYVNPYSYQAFLYRLYYKLTLPSGENFNKNVALKYSEVLKRVSERSMQAETSKHGLIIVSAFYGAASSITSCNFDSSDVINVTVPIQALVFNSKLKMSNSNKSLIPGFYDPCVDVIKLLFIEYYFNDISHLCIIPDDATAILPSREHQKTRLFHNSN